MKNILVTGGAGFVGSHLALGLKARHAGVSVVALDNLKRRGAELNLARLQAGGVSFQHGDIRNPEDLRSAGVFDLLVECSAEPSVLAGYGASPRYVIDTNLSGTVNCLEAAREHGADVVFLSTSRVYPMATIRNLRYEETDTRFELAGQQDVSGVSPEGFSEDFPLSGVRSMYGATKLASELLIAEYGDMYGLRTVVNRCGVLTGPWQMGKVDQGVVVLWVARHLFGGNLKYIGHGGTGKQVRDILHVHDLLDLVDLQLADWDTFNHGTWNVGGGRPVSVSLAELTQLCEAATGKTLKITGEPNDRVADIPLYLSDTRRVRAACAWKPSREPAQIIVEIARWIRDNEAVLRSILA